jgi:hypothetical protein
MRRITAQQALFTSVLLFMMSLAISCRKADSRESESPTQPETTHPQAGVEPLQRITLRITGMS